MFILIGGPTAIGKTKLVDLIISEGRGKFVRPVSYTTRPRRKGEGEQELRFISNKQFHRMMQEGKFLTVDNVYGNYYAMSKSSIYNALNDGKILIKEIHPKNFKKIKTLLGNDEVLSVILMPKNIHKFLSNIRDSDIPRFRKEVRRVDEDEKFFSSVAALQDADVVFIIDIDTPLERIANMLYTELRWRKMAKDVRTVEKINKDGCSSVLNVEHIADIGLYKLSIPFFIHHISQVQRSGKLVGKMLDISPCPQFVLGMLKYQETEQPVHLSPFTEDSLFRNATRGRMTPSDAPIVINGSVWNMPIRANAFPLITAGQADFFLNYWSLREIYRILQPSGELLLSMPTKLWAKLRAAVMGIPSLSTCVPSSPGGTQLRFSFTYSEEELKDLLTQAGFNILQFSRVYANTLTLSKDTILPEMISVIHAFGLPAEEIPLLYLIRASAPNYKGTPVDTTRCS